MGLRSDLMVLSSGNAVPVWAFSHLACLNVKYDRTESIGRVMPFNAEGQYLRFKDQDTVLVEFNQCVVHLAFR